MEISWLDGVQGPGSLRIWHAQPGCNPCVCLNYNFNGKQADCLT